MCSYKDPLNICLLNVLANIAILIVRNGELGRKLRKM
jgi:hypothetical protein